MKYIGILLFALCGAISCSAPVDYDVVVIGGTTSGTSAAIRSARMGAKTLVVEPQEWLGGMLTSAGVSATDGNYRLRGGAIWDEFRDSLEANYGGAEALKTGWVSNILFEPSVGNRIFCNIAKAEEMLDVWFRSSPTKFTQMEDDSWVINMVCEGEEQVVKCRILIDATELGDVAKELGVGYDVGMDSREVTDEDIAPREANNIVQDLTYAVILKDYKRDVTIEEPEGYDPSLFASCCINELSVNPKEAHRLWPREKMITYGKLPNDKYMINWPIEGNDYYVNMVDISAEERIKAEERAKNHTLSFLYFLQTELGFNTLGIADDEFPTEDGLPFTPYHRESRRIHGAVRFTLNHITDPYRCEQQLYRTAIAVGDYPVDQHHTRYSGWAELPDLYFHPVPSYGVPLGVIIPDERRALLVAEKSISVTNIVNGSTRLQPVVLQIGEAAGTLAALAAMRGCDVRDIGVREVQQITLDMGGYLLPYLDLEYSDPHFEAMQHIGATGIIKGHGANVGWENQSWFDADKTISCKELNEGLREIYSRVCIDSSQESVTSNYLSRAIAEVEGCDVATIEQKIDESWSALGLNNYEPARSLTRLECAVVIDSLLNPFHRVDIDIYGDY